MWAWRDFMKLVDRFNGVKFIAVKGILTVNFFFLTWEAEGERELTSMLTFPKYTQSQGKGWKLESSKYSWPYLITVGLSQPGWRLRDHPHSSACICIIPLLFNEPCFCAHLYPHRPVILICNGSKEHELNLTKGLSNPGLGSQSLHQELDAQLRSSTQVGYPTCLSNFLL